ncbi:13537_t:CDS:2, partial [Funneliformis caledonium]
MPLHKLLENFVIHDYLSLTEFSESNQKTYGDIYEVHLGVRRIILSRTEYVEKLLMPSTKSQYMMRFPYSKGLAELGVIGKGLLANHDLKSWRYNRQFFTQAILAPKFTQEAIGWTNELFNELESYWN